MDNDVLDGAENNSNEPAPSPETPAVPNLTDQLRETLGPTIAHIGQSLQTLQEQQAEINQRLEGEGGTLKPETNASGEATSDFDKLYEDPNKFLAGVMNEVLDKRGTGGVDTILEQLSQQNVAVNEKRIDDYYGEGTWKDVLSPILEQAFNQLDPEVRANAESMKTIVDAAVGQENVRDQLVQKRTEMMNRPKPPSLPGNGIPANREPADQLSSTEKIFAQSNNIDEKVFLELGKTSRNGSTSLNDYLAATGKEGQ
jgi:hypothetical protein